MTAQIADLDEIVEEFSFLGDWEERYRHLIEMGRAQPVFDDADKSEANRVKGCVSQVWLLISTGPPPDRVMTFRGDSDAHIVRGLVALLTRVYSGRSPEDVIALDAEGLLERLGLDAHLSPSRSNGLRAMVTRIRAEAREAQSSAGNP